MAVVLLFLLALYNNILLGIKSRNFPNLSFNNKCIPKDIIILTEHKSNLLDFHVKLNFTSKPYLPKKKNSKIWFWI